MSTEELLGFDEITVRTSKAISIAGVTYSILFYVYWMLKPISLIPGSTIEVHPQALTHLWAWNMQFPHSDTPIGT